jgi:uncharacterized protein (DUF885 family)
MNPRFDDRQTPRFRFPRSGWSWVIYGCVSLGVIGSEVHAQHRESPSQSGFSDEVAQYSADVNTLSRRFRLPIDAVAQEIRDHHTQAWNERLDAASWETLSLDGAIDWLALKGELEHRTKAWSQRRDTALAAKALVPYADQVLRICASREHGIDLRAEDAADLLNQIAKEANQLAKNIQSERSNGEQHQESTSPIQALEASEFIDQLLRSLQESQRYRDGYDPSYSWWAEKPYESARQAITSHRKALRERLAGITDGDNDRIVGIPIGDAALRDALRHAWIAYSPEELIRIGEQEMKWCDQEFAKAATELGMDGDWRKALEHVKSLHVEPGDQPRLIRELAWEAIRFLEGNALVTVPDLAKHGWRVEMMTPEAQRVNPYFLGGENIIVSFPTNAMQHEEKLMSLRSNNIHFCRATVHHELIPGHHLQTYALSRYRPYRELFRTPFWTEGWALYWEMLLWDLDFAQSAEDRVGMLFWRRHRAARILFSLNYQTGRWSPEQCVQYLIGPRRT